MTLTAADYLGSLLGLPGVRQAAGRTCWEASPGKKGWVVTQSDQRNQQEGGVLGRGVAILQERSQAF